MPSVSLAQSQQQKLTQTQTMSPVQRQSLEILQLPILALEQKIREEAETNPAIKEVIAPDFELATPTDYDDSRESARDEKRFEDEYQEHSPSTSQYSSDDAEERRRYMFESIKQPVSLESHLRGQIGIADFSEAEAEIAEMIVANLGPTGMLSVNLAEMAEVCGVPLETVEKVLAVIQDTFDPPGIAARDLGEQLALQLKYVDSPLVPLAVRIVKEHLEDLAKGGRESAMAASLDASLADVNAAEKLIKSLNPNPIAEYDPVSPTDFIIPELEVIRGKDGRWHVKMDSSLAMQLKIDDGLRHYLKLDSVPPEDKSFIREKLRTAEALVNSLELRGKTIHAIGREIVEEQQEFFTYGVSRLKPMTLSRIAEKIGCHETTVGRAVAGKYLRSPLGIFELKYFFSAGLKSSGDGTAVSNKAVMNRISEIVRGENPAKPYSDQDILGILVREGIDIKRRTIAKYRENLGIAPSAKRRKR